MPIAIKDVPLFHGLSERELASIKKNLIEKSFKKNEILIHEGNACERVVIVREGRVKLCRTSSAGREQILEILGPGDTCACNPGALKWFCPCSAEAATDCKIWFLSRDNYVRMVQTNTKISRSLNQLFAERLQYFSSLIEEVSLKDCRRRLIKFLLDMLEHRPEGQTKEVLDIPFTREEIAQRIGAARETVARQLYKLKRIKLISIQPHKITILNKEGLKKLL